MTLKFQHGGSGNVAVFSDDELYRYELRWRLADRPPHGDVVIGFVMLNPSTATAEKLDATLTRCAGFARREGATLMVVGNLFAYRAANPKQLLEVADPVGPVNAQALMGLTSAARRVILGWGTWARRRDLRDLSLEWWLLGWLRGVGHHPECLGVNADGSPRHPLYVPHDTPLEPYRGAQ